MTMREPLGGDLAPEQAVLWLREDPGAFALVGEWAGVSAILGSAPLAVAPADADPFAVLDELPRDISPREDGPVVGGGWFGWLGYPLGSLVEALPPEPPARRAIAPWSLGFYDHVVVFDGERWWFEALWTPERDDALRERLALWRERIAAPPRAPRPVEVAAFSPVSPGGAGHRLAVAEAVEMIAAGDLFQANVCLRIEASWPGAGAAELFARALPAAAPRFGALFGESVVSLSPERFLRRVGRRVETDPIKGTADDPAALLGSDKDAAEHVMIVDLMRNDLGRVCEYGSIVAHDARVEPHANVFHLVSTVSGELRAGATDADLLRATFPPGSVTGAPKVQAMKTIARLEATARGVYTGAIGYASPIAGLELSVAIRTFEADRERIWLGAGGGIVADSTPEAELAEALTKAAGPIAAISSTLGSEFRAEDAKASPTGARGLPRALDLADRPDPRLGVFETLLAIDGEPQHLEAHLQRLTLSLADLYDASLPPEAPALVAKAAATMPIGRSRVRLEARPNGAAIALEARAAPAGEAARPRALTPYLLPGGFGAHKWIDRRLHEALAADAPAGTWPLLVDGDGLILETHTTNVWIREGDRLTTPPADGRILPGVTRAQRLAEEPGAAEEPITLERWQVADATLLSSAIALTRPVG